MLLGDQELNDITRRIIGCAYKVNGVLGCGFLEKVYEKALAHELRKAGLRVEVQYPTPVHYDGELVGDYVADLLVEGLVLVELKVVRNLDELHHAQCLNYLAATKLIVCLLINFSKRVCVKRFMGQGEGEEM